MSLFLGHTDFHAICLFDRIRNGAVVSFAFFSSSEKIASDPKKHHITDAAVTLCRIHTRNAASAFLPQENHSEMCLAPNEIGCVRFTVYGAHSVTPRERINSALGSSGLLSSGCGDAEGNLLAKSHFVRS